MDSIDSLRCTVSTEYITCREDDLQKLRNSEYDDPQLFATPRGLFYDHNISSRSPKAMLHNLPPTEPRSPASRGETQTPKVRRTRDFLRQETSCVRVYRNWYLTTWNGYGGCKLRPVLG